MLVSILHRVSGDGMAVVALPVLLWWLGSVASGPAAYEAFTDIATSWYGYVVLVGISWAFFNHLCSTEARELAIGRACPPSSLPGRAAESAGPLPKPCGHAAPR